MCNSCGGDLKEGFVDHVMKLEGQIIIVEKVPARICTQCGDYFFKTKTMLKLEEIRNYIKNNHMKLSIITYGELVV